jgi:hypothetical protein
VADSAQLAGSRELVEAGVTGGIDRAWGIVASIEHEYEHEYEYDRTRRKLKAMPLREWR